MKELNAKNYLESIKNKIKLSKVIVLSPHKWLVEDLIGSVKHKTWSSNGALIYKTDKYDFLVCLPGASMAMITMEESLASGAKKIIYIGTGAGLQNQPSGTLLTNPQVISVLNPFTEQNDIDWSKVIKEKIEIVDMEAEYLMNLALIKKANLLVLLIVADHVSKKEWAPLIIEKNYIKKYKKAINKIKKILRIR